ncbi:MAG: hypothetical protein AMXMBFR12_06000 [Candidatus Babeliales bacterium]
MKQSTFVTLFACCNLGMLLLHIHKQSKMIELSFTKQKLETQRITLLKQKQELTHQLHALHNLRDVKQFALNELALKPVKISQIKKIPHDTTI